MAVCARPDRGHRLVEWFFVLTAAAYNVIRIPKLLAAASIRSICRHSHGRRAVYYIADFASILGLIGGGDNLIDPSSVRKLIERHVAFSNLEQAPVPAHVIATNLGGSAVCLSTGRAVEAILASADDIAAAFCMH